MSIDHWAEMIRHHRTLEEMSIAHYLDYIEESKASGFSSESTAATRLKLDAHFMRETADRLDKARLQITQPERT